MIARPFTILQVLPKLDAGGAERVVVETAEALTRAGHRALIATEDGRLSAAAARAGAEIINLPLATKAPFKIWRNIRRLEKVIKAYKVDLVHAHSRAPAWSAFHAARRRKIPFVTTYHGTYGEKSKAKKRYNQVMARGDRVIAVSQFIADLIRSRYGIGPERVRVIHGGVDTGIFDTEAVRGDRAVRLAREWGADAGHPAIMLPGRLTPWKGQRVFIEALAKMRHKDSQGLLVGSDQGRKDYAAELLALARKRGVADRLRLAGHTDDMPAALMLADVVVNASTEPEAFGRTIVEAQSMGRIVVAADHGGARETILSGETGLLFPPGDAAALAALLDSVLDETVDARVAFGRQAREHIVRHFSLAAMQEKVLSVYAELLG